MPYACNNRVHLQTVLAEQVHERGQVDAHRLPIMLEGIAAFVEMGTRCAT